MSVDAYKVWTLIFNGLTAIGTVGAVWVALFLYRRQDEPKISVSAGIFEYINPLFDEGYEGVLIKAQNVGIRREKVSMYGYTIGFLRMVKIYKEGTSCFIKTDSNSGIPNMAGIPSDVESGEAASHFMPLMQFDELQLSFFFKYLDGLPAPDFIKRSAWFKRAALWTARCWVTTSREKSASARLNPSLRKYILERYEMGDDESVKTVMGDEPIDEAFDESVEDDDFVEEIELVQDMKYVDEGKLIELEDSDQPHIEEENPKS